MAAEQFVSAPAVGDPATAAWASRVADDSVIADSGKVSMTAPGGGTGVSQSITFNKVFPSPPVVTVTVRTTAPLTAQASINAESTTGCDIWFARSDSGSHTNTIEWIAILTQ